MAGGKGGSQTTTVEVPEYIEEAAKRNLARAQQISQIGYTPYYGPDVAAFTPLQEASMQNLAGTAGAFGLATPAGGPMSGMPAPQEFAGGMRGYSSAPMFEEALDEFGRRRPAQKAYIDAMFIDPFSGEYTPVYQPVAPIEPVAPVAPSTPSTPAAPSRPTITADPRPVFTASVDPSRDIAADIDDLIQAVDQNGTSVVPVGDGTIVVGGDALDLTGQPVDSLTQQQIADLSDLGLAQAVDYNLAGGTTFIPTESGFDSETEALRARIEDVSDIERARAEDRMDQITFEAAMSGRPVQDVALDIEQERPQRFGVTAGGTTTANTSMQLADAYDPRAAALGQPTATDITGTQAEETFGADLLRSLTDPDYDPEGTVLSRLLGGIGGEPTPPAQLTPMQEAALGGSDVMRDYIASGGAAGGPSMSGGATTDRLYAAQAEKQAIQAQAAVDAAAANQAIAAGAAAPTGRFIVQRYDEATPQIFTDQAAAERYARAFGTTAVPETAAAT